MHPCVETLYKDHRAWLEAWLRRRLQDRFDAEDLTQDTFERLFTRRDVTAINEPRALLTTIAKGIVYNFYRRRSIEETYKEMLAQMAPEHVPSQEARAIVLEELAELDRRLGRLAPKVRKAFLLSQLEGMSQAEICVALGISRATVQRYLVQALRACCFEA